MGLHPGEARCTDQTLRQLDRGDVRGRQDAFTRSFGNLPLYQMAVTRIFGHLDRLPWIVGRLDLPGVRDKAIALFNRVPLARHTLLVRELFDVTTPGNLREEVDLITPDGGNVQPQLSMVLKGVQASPMDDKVHETPHAVVKKAMASAASYGFPWAASSSRLSQNLTDAEELPPAVNIDLQTEWDG